jgi:hypothetical protein
VELEIQNRAEDEKKKQEAFKEHEKKAEEQRLA